MPEAIVVGSINMDIVLSVDRIPAPGETLSASALDHFPGGKGANQAVALARVGRDVVMIGHVGDDAYGATLIEGLRENGVGTQGVTTLDDTPSGLAFIAVSDEGENAIIIMAGANGKLLTTDVDAHRSLFSEARMLLTQFEAPMETVVHALTLAREAGLTTLVNAAPARPIEAAREAVTLSDVLIVNETETESLTGLPVTNIASAIEGGQALLGLGAGSVILTLGAEGSVYVNKDSSGHAPAFSIKAVDTTAAGDAFIGALCSALLDDTSLDQALRFANAAGALAATVPGAQPSLPTREKILEMLDD
jgi:ribokinase